MRPNQYFAIALVALLVPATAAFAIPPLYSIKDLTPAGYTNSIAYDINSDGDAVGVATKYVGGSPVEAYFYYDHSAGTSTAFGEGVVSPRGTIIGSGFREAAINDSGAVAGTAMFIGGAAESRGFIYSGSTFTSLGTLYLGPGTGSNIRPASDALDINSSGIAVGTATSGAASSDNNDIYIGTTSPVTDIDTDLTIVTAGDRGRAMNDAGLIAGSNEAGKATLFSGAGETTFLVGTSLDAAASTVATDLNEVGQVTGHTGTTASSSFLYDTTDSSLTIIPNMDTGSRIFAKAINEDGDVVGWGDRSPGLSGMGRGFVYTDSTTYVLEDHVVLTGSDTPGLGDWEALRTAWGINDDGWIVGTGDRRFDGATFPNPRAYLLIPTCIPGDTDHDQDIDTADLTTSISNFTGAGGTGKECEDGDTDDDGDVDTADLTYSITNFTGALAANPNVPDLVYDPATGNVTLDADGADVISFSLQAGPFSAADFSDLPAGLTDNIANQIGWTSFNLFSGLTGTANLGAILPAGLDEAQLNAALTTASYGLALSGGGGGGRLDIIIPEPTTMILLIIGGAATTRRTRR